MYSWALILVFKTKFEIGDIEIIYHVEVDTKYQKLETYSSINYSIVSFILVARTTYFKITIVINIIYIMVLLRYLSNWIFV